MPFLFLETDKGGGEMGGLNMKGEMEVGGRRTFRWSSQHPSEEGLQNVHWPHSSQVVPAKLYLSLSGRWSMQDKPSSFRFVMTDRGGGMRERERESERMFLRLRHTYKSFNMTLPVPKFFAPIFFWGTSIGHYCAAFHE